MSSVRVAVRVRPLSKREKQLSSKVIVQMKGNTASVHKPSSVRGDKLGERGKIFSYDFSYDSTDRESPTFASQEKIFQDLGSDVLKAAFEGFNACVFAYGQTGSGKTYTMMGHKVDKGLIPRLCEGLFTEISNRSNSETVSYNVEVREKEFMMRLSPSPDFSSLKNVQNIVRSYLELYNERVQDLLKKKSPCTEGGLKVREHPSDGPYVENLSKHMAHSQRDVEGWISLGNANRTIASTGMNDFSSRSHAILTITFTQAWFEGELPRERLSKIHLVDLAGSEKADATNTTGTRLKEGANINKSLVTLGSVISALADLSVGGPSAKKKQIFIPYRDSVLTWLLKDSLGGNSKTTMIATISPAHTNYEETLSTLRYASRAKNIMNTPRVNEDGTVKMIRELQAEVARLQILLAEATQVSNSESTSTEKVEEKLYQNEAKIEALTKKWSRTFGETGSVLQPLCCFMVTHGRDAAILCGLRARKSSHKEFTFLQEETTAVKEGSGAVSDCPLPHLIGVDEDLLRTEINLYYLKEGRTLIGSDEALCSQDIVLHGPGLLCEHCVLENCAGTVTLFPQDGALCSVNGSVVTDPCQLTQGAIIQLGRRTTLRFNQPAEAFQLREKQQRGLLSAFAPSLTDLSKSTKNPSMAMLQNSSHFIQMDVLGAENESKDPQVCLKSAPAEMLMTTAIPERNPVPHASLELDGDALQGGVSIGDGQEQERDLCHKSGPGLMSERPQRRAQSGAGVESCSGEEVWSGNASLQQTSVLGPGDGCGTKPEGNANEIQGVVTDCYKGRPGSGGSLLGSASHLQRNGESSFTSAIQETGTHSPLNGKPLDAQMACCPPKDAACENECSREETDKSGSLEEIPEVCLTKTAAPRGQKSGFGFLFSRVSGLVQDAHHLLWNSPKLLQQVTNVRLQPIGSHWSSHVVSLVKERNVVSIVRDNSVFSVVRGSFVFSLLRDSYLFSVVKEFPLVQLIQMSITQHFQPKEAAQMIQDCINPGDAQLPALTPTQTVTEQSQVDEQQISEDFSKKDLQSPQKQDGIDSHVKQRDENVTKPLLLKQINETEIVQAPEDADKALDNLKATQIATQSLIEFPDPLLKLKHLPFKVMIHTLRSIMFSSTFPSQKIKALYWVTVAKCSQPEPQPGLLILMETDFCTLTADAELLVLFHHLPLVQLREIQIGLAGQSLRLMGTNDDSILGVYTYSQKHTKELCRAILDDVCPGDSRISQYPLMNEDLMKLSLDCQGFVPDLLLDTGLTLGCQFQKSFADLVYYLHCNMNLPEVALGEVQLLMYTSVAVQISPSTCSERVAQFFLTDTHLGLVREDTGFHPTPHFVTTAACRPQFHDLTLRRRADVRCIMVHDENATGSVRLDVILTNVRARGHPESVAKAATPSEHALNSSLHAEVWKLTFSCSTEATCLINHLSNV